MERGEKEAQAILKSRMMLFPKWTLNRIQNDVVGLPSQYSLEPVPSFDIQNTQDSQLDLPLPHNAFRFRSLVKVANTPFIDSGSNQMLFAFYLKNMKPQYETWSAHKIVIVKVTRPIETESFPNVKFKVARGSACDAYEFTLADLPCFNPNEWMVVFNMLQKEKAKYEPVMSHLQLMIKSYIQEFGLLDLDIATHLKKKPNVVPKEAPKDFENLKPGRIYKE